MMTKEQMDSLRTRNINYLDSLRIAEREKYAG